LFTHQFLTKLKSNFLKRIVSVFLFIATVSLGQTKQTVADSILHILKNTNEQPNILKTLTELGNTRYPKKSDSIINILLKKTTNSNEKAKCYYSLANYYYFNNQLDSALAAIKKAENQIIPIETTLFYVSVKTTRAGILKKTGDVINANKLLLEALQLLEQMDTLKMSKKTLFKSKGKKIVLYNSIANFNIDLGNFSLANDYLSKAIDLAKALNEKRSASVLLNNKGLLFLKMEKYQEALDILKESEHLKKTNNLPESIILSTTSNIAKALYKLHKTEEALNSYNSIITHLDKQTNRSLWAEVLLGRGTIFSDKKWYDKALKDFEKSYHIATAIKDINLQKQASEKLFSLLYKTKSYKKAFDYQEIYFTLKDSIFNEQNIKKLTQQKMQYEFDKKLALQDIQTKIATQKNNQIIRILALSLFALIVTLGLGYRLYNLKKKNSIVLKKKNRIINKQLNKNNTLLKETHHRVKNSLQMISSLLYLQSENIEDDKAAASVKDGQIRVKSMALIHQKLYQNDTLTGVEVSDYIEDLAHSIFESHRIDNQHITLDISVEKMVLDIETITPIGIIINELIVNSLKHAFPKGEQGEISISLYKKAQQLILKVVDNGKGFIAEEKKEKSFGMKLIKLLSKSLKAELQITHKNGTAVVLIINRFNIK